MRILGYVGAIQHTLIFVQAVVPECGFISLLFIFFRETHTFKCGFKKVSSTLYNLCPSGEGISYKVKKNPACRIFRLRQIAQRHAFLRPQYNNCFLPYGKFRNFSIWQKVSLALHVASFWQRTFLYRIRVPKVLPAVALGRWYKKILGK